MKFNIKHHILHYSIRGMCLVSLSFDRICLLKYKMQFVAAGDSITCPSVGPSVFWDVHCHQCLPIMMTPVSLKV